MIIKDFIRLLAQSGEELYCKVCTVDSVDYDTRTVDCTPIDESAPILAANLQANQQSKTGVVTYPKIGSYVVVGFLNQATAVVLLCDEIERIEFAIGEITAQVDVSGMVINGGGFGGLVKVGELTDKLNELIDAFNEHTHTLPSSSVAVTGSPSAQSNPQPITVPAITGKSEKFNRSDYENEKVKH